MPLHPAAGRLIAEYLEAAGHGDEEAGALFRPLHYARWCRVRGYTTAALGETFGAHAMRSIVASNALAIGADIAKVQELLGHATSALPAFTIIDTRSPKTALL